MKFKNIRGYSNEKIKFKTFGDLCEPWVQLSKAKHLSWHDYFDGNVVRNIVIDLSPEVMTYLAIKVSEIILILEYT